MNKIIRNTIILTVITLISGLLLGVAYEVTKDPIAQANEEAKKEAWQAVFPDADIDAFETVDVDQDIAKQAISDAGIEGSIDEVSAVDGGEAGYVITVTDGEGYGGDIQMTVGITADGSISGISFLSISGDSRSWYESKGRVLLRTVCRRTGRSVLRFQRRRRRGTYRCYQRCHYHIKSGDRRCKRSNRLFPECILGGS